MGVFVLDAQGLVALTPKEFVCEDEFQGLLEKYPDLLSGNQSDTEVPRRWLLIKREKEIPSEEGGAARWLVDHLFLDQEGIPTLVEVKRQTDTRLRREVVGQMLEYAANAIMYWPVAELRTEFEQGCSVNGLIPGEEIRERLGVGTDPEVFWHGVETNLRAGRIRMLFIADRIPSELRRIVEFLNQQMNPAEVLALELRQYQGERVKTIVPMLYGQTEEAKRTKTLARSRQWDEESIYEDIEQRKGSEALRVMQQIIAWFKTQPGRLWYGQGAQDGSVGLVVTENGVDHIPILLYTYGTAEIQFQHMKKKNPFDDTDRREELRERLNAINGVNVPADAIDRRPSIQLMALSNDEKLNQFLNVMEWCIRQLRANDNSTSGLNSSTIG
ncbi:MAG: hypothetical protein JO007_05800 [Alphaproteobacteria bacterium]|nr:hypothetical protein [Alphaproteobacteria bacterium]